MRPEDLRSDPRRHGAAALAAPASPRPFDGDGSLFRLAAEAHRLQLAYLFDPLLAVHTSDVDPLPHQIIAVYDVLLRRNPLRFLLADDPGAGKTIMTGLLLRELMARGDVRRCLIVCPGNLVEQWHEELAQRFQLRIPILTNELLAASPTGNPFLEHDLLLARMDHLARNEGLQAKLAHPANRYDLVVVDEAHKMSASVSGREVRTTRRYRLGQRLARQTRHLLLLTATPHNGKEQDFQAFLALLDADRFAGVYRPRAHARTDTSDLLLRRQKEDLRRMDGTPLFPERRATTVSYPLSPAEQALYDAVTAYVRREWGRAERLSDRSRAAAVGFALTLLQRRLASSTEAILQSLARRRARLQEQLERARSRRVALGVRLDDLNDLDDPDDLDDLPEDERLAYEDALLSRATAADSLADLEAEIATLHALEAQARELRRRGEDTKWRELSQLLASLFGPQADPALGPPGQRKLVVFTEHRDTLAYFERRIGDLLGPERVVTIHGGLTREERLRRQHVFVHDPHVQVLVATDAAGEGINLQRAHLMVNYDLPWNPARLEQRFGRIHRIGQTEVCHLWNLVAEGTREGDVYRRLLDKLEEARTALGGRVFDVLGRLQFDGRPLRELLADAIRYGDRPEVRARLTQAIDGAVDPAALHALLESDALAREVLGPAQVRRVREAMERAAAQRLQPRHVATFFRAAFEHLGGLMHEREEGRYEITHVPLQVRERMQRPANAPAPDRYERVTFDKTRLAAPGAPTAVLLHPGHPLVRAVTDLLLDAHRPTLQRGAVLVDAAAIGDDRLQRRARGTVVPESFTHGTSAQRVGWFRRGWAEGEVASCDTFAAPAL